MQTDLPEAPEFPRYAQMARDIEARIGSGALPPGARLPSFGRMRAEYGASPATMERVYATLEKKGLIRREAKRGIFVAEPKPPVQSTIGVIWNYDDSRDFYYAQILRGIQNATQKNGLRLLLLPDPASLHGAGVDGLILSGYQGDHGAADYKERFLALLPAGLPTVCVLGRAEKIPEVVSDDRRGILDAGEHLLALGHRRIAYLGAGRQWNADDLSQERMAAYNEVLTAAGIDPDPAWVRDMLTIHEAWSPLGFREQARRKMAEWLQEGWGDLGCTALLAQNDDAAIGAIDALRESGYRVPEDVSVVGFDGTLNADYFSPRLTTVKVPLKSLGESSVEMLVESMAVSPGRETAAGHRQIVLPTELRVGESTAQVGSAARENTAAGRSVQAKPRASRKPVLRPVVT